MATIDSRLLEALEASTCFGIAHDESVPECMQCDVRLQCKKKSEGADIPTPTTAAKVVKEVVEEKPKAPKKTAKKEPAKPKATTSTKKATPAPKKDTAKPTPSGNIPDFKAMSLDELKDMASEKSVEWKDYGNDQITRMRLIMALKKAM